MRRNFVPRNSGIRQVGSAHREGEGLAGNEGRGVGHGHLLPIGGDHADQLDVAGALRGQIRGIVEGLGGAVAPASAVWPSTVTAKSVVEADRAWK